MRLLAANRLSDNVGGVKQSSSTLQHVLLQSAILLSLKLLILLYQPKLARNQDSGLDSVRPMHLFGLQLRELDISCLQWSQIADVNDTDRPDLLERRLVESHTTVVIPFDDRVLFVSSLNCTEFSSRLSEVAQTLDAISGTQFLTGGRGLGERWFLGTV
jgi:hypothetical protein